MEVCMEENPSNKDETYAVEMLHITKTFPGIIANDDITLQVKKGEIHALLGENGAGKSTLMSVLFGFYQAEKGEIHINGEKVTINDPNDATRLHIGMVHQHFKLVQNFTVLDNIIMGVEPLAKNDWCNDKNENNCSKFKKVLHKIGRFFGKLFNCENENINRIIDRKAAAKRVNDLSAKYGLNIDVNAYIENITVGMQQRVEILKMLYRNNDILIFDEPTAVLTPQEITELMQIMRNLVKEGKSILFITHKLKEIKAVADRVTVLRKGKYVGTVDVKGATEEELSEMMVGRKVQLVVDKSEAKPTEEVLRVENMVVVNKEHHKNVVNNVSFNVRAGEIVCIAGIDGNGQTELVYSITGLLPPKEGKVYLLNEDITDLNIRKKNVKGISHIPEDRHKHGLVLDFSLEQNLVLERYFEPTFAKGGFINFKAVRDYANKLIDAYDIRSSQGPITMARSMSGGNQQKAIVARELDRDSKLLIAVQPTRGLDVGAIEHIHSKIVKERDEGKAILLVSLELEEVLALSDRILVMYEGEIVGQFKGGHVTPNELGLYMSGAKRQKVNAIMKEGE
jgi:ABC-type uncharacterized transport system ATPase subunit